MHFVELGFRAAPQTRRSELPPYLGATLRGAFGSLLKRTVCQVSHGICDHCVLQTACPYPAIFEGLPPADRTFMRKYPRIPQPFVLLVPPIQSDPEEECGPLCWGVRLFGSAVRYWPYVVHGFQLAGKEGIGQRRVKYTLEEVTDSPDGQPIWSSENERFSNPSTRQVTAQGGSIPEVCTLRWKFHTPVQLVREHHLLGINFNGLDFVLAGRRRHAIMSEFYGQPRDESDGLDRVEGAEFSTVENRLRVWGLERYSTRQQQRMSLRGTLGEIVITGPWGRTGPWLDAIPKLHLGKATSFGFGNVTWELV